jgi:hypothetical protein
MLRTSSCATACRRRTTHPSAASNQLRGQDGGPERCRRVQSIYKALRPADVVISTVARETQRIAERSTRMPRLRPALAAASAVAALLPGYANGATRTRALHSLGLIRSAVVKSDGDNVAAWQADVSSITIWVRDSAHTSPLPRSSCDPDPVKAVGSGYVLFWCGAQHLTIIDASSGQTRVTNATDNLDGPANGTVPTNWSIGRNWVLLEWPTSLEQGNYQREVQWHSNEVRPTTPDASHWLDLDSTHLLRRPCLTGTGRRVISQSNGFALLLADNGHGHELVRCSNRHRTRQLIGDSVQLGGGWVTWRDRQSLRYVSALRLADMRVFRYKLPPIARSGGLRPSATITIAHTSDRIFVADDFAGAPMLRTARLPRR